MEEKNSNSYPKFSVYDLILYSTMLLLFLMNLTIYQSPNYQYLTPFNFSLTQYYSIPNNKFHYSDKLANPSIYSPDQTTNNHPDTNRYSHNRHNYNQNPPNNERNQHNYDQQNDISFNERNRNNDQNSNNERDRQNFDRNQPNNNYPNRDRYWQRRHNYDQNDRPFNDRNNDQNFNRDQPNNNYPNRDRYSHDRHKYDQNDRPFNDRNNDQNFNNERSHQNFNRDQQNEEKHRQNQHKYDQNDIPFNDRSQQNDDLYRQNNRNYDQNENNNDQSRDIYSNNRHNFDQNQPNNERHHHNYNRDEILKRNEERNRNKYHNFNRDRLINNPDKDSEKYQDNNNINNNNNSTETSPHFSMVDALMGSDLRGKDFYQLRKDRQQELMHRILQIDIREPFYPADESCQVPSLINYTDELCSAAGPAFTGKLRKNNPKMAHIINFAFEVDVLEIHLNELYPVVDKIFLCECAYIHGKSGLKKPCVWDMIKDQPRFSKFKDKVVLLWISEEEIGGHSYFYYEWKVEYAMEEKRWKKFLQWNEENKFFEENDVVGFGDADEIASIYNLNLIKHCETKTITDVGIWFTRGRITEKVKTDWPVKGEPFALGDPSFFTIKQARRFPHGMPSCHQPCNYPGRTRGFAPNFVLGGLHLSSYKFMPQYILKLISMTEHRDTESAEFKRIMEKIINGENIQSIQKDIALKKFSHKLGGDILTMDQNDIGTKQYILPWFLKCNQKRYSTFFLNIIDDPRLE